MVAIGPADGAGGGTTPARTMALERLFRSVSSVAVVVAWPDGANVPATGARNVSRIVCVAPGARSPAVHVFVVALNAAGVDADTNVSPPKLTTTFDAVAAAAPLFLSVKVTVTVPPGLMVVLPGDCVSTRSARACSPNVYPVAAAPEARWMSVIRSLVVVLPSAVPAVSFPSA